jgi:hypothetical protein
MAATGQSTALADGGEIVADMFLRLRYFLGLSAGEASALTIQ